MKKLILMLSVAVLLVCAFAISVSAATEIGGIYYRLSGEGENAVAAVTSDNVNCTLETVVIPETVEYEGVTYKVTAIDDMAFSGSNPKWAGNKIITSISIPESVSSIGAHIFRNCTALQSVVIKAKNESGITLSDAEFYNCTELASVDMSESDITSFNQYTFFGCSKLVTFNYPPRLKLIGGQSFRGCKSLTSGDLSGTQLEKISSWGFGDCTSLTELKFPTTFKEIHGNALQNCKITELVFPHGFYYMGNDSLPFNRQLYMVILPEIAEDNTTIHPEAMHDTNPKVVIYAGTSYEHLTGSGKLFSKYTVKPFSEYDPSVTYTEKTFFYGADTCDTCNGLLGEESFKYTDLLSEMKVSTACTNCVAENVSESYAPVFVDLGYSTFELNGYCSIVQGFKVNYGSVDKYNEQLEADILSFGVLAVAQSKVGDVAFDENGNALAGVLTSQIKSGHDYFDIKVVNIPLNEMVDENTAYADAKLHLCAYVVIGDEIYYVTEGYFGKSLGDAVSYNSLK